MDPAVYVDMAKHEDVHWWFRGRRAAIRGAISRLRIPADAAILEAGCGTGGNLALLGSIGDVDAFDTYPPAVEVASRKYPGATVYHGTLPDFPLGVGHSYDVVAAFDVLEHVEDDASAFATLWRAVRPGGYFVITVPAHRGLWSSHDRRLMHRRRYCRSDLMRLIRTVEADISFFSAFNTLLAPPAVALRLAERLIRRDLVNQERMPAGRINSVLGSIFELEGAFLRRARIPFGLSYVVALRKPSEHAGA